MKEKIVRFVAGGLILISLTLSYFFNLNWLWLSAFVGLNLFQSSMTHFCPLEKILDAIGVEKKSSKI